MRLRLILVCALIAAEVAAADQAPKLEVAVPDQLSISNSVASEMTNYRGPDGEYWLLVTMQGQGEFADQAKIQTMQEQVDVEFRRRAELYVKARAPYRIEKVAISDSGVLLLFASQEYRDGKQYSLLEFHSFWSAGVQVKGQIQWPGALEPKVDNYVDRLRSMRVRGR